MSEPKRLNDVYNAWFTSFGFFTALYAYLSLHSGADPPPEWLTAETSRLIDRMYHGNVSGQKIIAPLLRNFLRDDGTISIDSAQMIASMWWTMYGTYAAKQYAVLSIQYNPTHNYDMTEAGTDSADSDKSNVRTGGRTTTQTGQTQSSTDSAANAYGFDSVTPAGVDTGNTTTTTTIGANNAPLTQTEQYNALTDTAEEAETREHTLTRSGNIGVTTTQQMIQSELDLWQWNFLRDFIFPTVDLILTLPIY